ncbi:hypothetical protein VFPPC_18165 [Pochonia chlamydosporia 170]|uniref:Uncharacterized protein n=1 Tax=Pochonia chlamydosporia 170 TaxID=1380566 RepID=A0A219ASP5_METCM|nr:hypothetical protein VFPPC_18165 [Pochonia chlamydosporia 170]OWT43632.1 hypothetical protein VFPPC_18165 [Pochonia chlamydosporia 170]
MPRRRGGGLTRSPPASRMGRTRPWSLPSCMKINALVLRCHHTADSLPCPYHVVSVSEATHVVSSSAFSCPLEHIATHWHSNWTPTGAVSSISVLGCSGVCGGMWVAVVFHDIKASRRVNMNGP